MDHLRDELAWIRAHLGDLSQSSFETKRELVEIRANLQEHMRRTALAEENIERIRAEVKPISTHVAVVGALGKLVVLLGTIVGIGVGLLKIAEYFRG